MGIKDNVSSQYLTTLLMVAPLLSSGLLILLEGNASSASYFLAVAIAGGPVKVHGTGSASVQGDATFAEVLHLMGAQVE